MTETMIDHEREEWLSAHSWASQPELRRGSRGEAVAELQHFLNNYATCTADGVFGPQTAGCVTHVKTRMGIRPATPVVTKDDWRRFAYAGLDLSRDGLDAPTGAKKDSVFGPLTYATDVLVAGGPVRITNDFRSRIQRVEIPQLAGVYGATRDGLMYWHEDYVDNLRGFFEAVEWAGLQDRIISYAGSWVPRFVRGSKRTLSSHAYGTAFDINAPQNWIRARPASVGAKGSVRELVPIAEAYGFMWGGDFRRPDGMHFEISMQFATSPWELPDPTTFAPTSNECRA